MTKITKDDIIQINELYKQLGSYAAVARELGFAASTIKKYVQPGYIPRDEIVLNRVDMNRCRAIIENHTLSAADIENEHLLELTAEEAKEMEEIWKEIVV